MFSATCLMKSTIESPNERIGRQYGVPLAERESDKSKVLTKKVSFQTDPLPAACRRTKKELCSRYVPKREVVMLRVFVEEAAALASIGLFVGMIAVWAQLIPQF
jgi:hypothetical protein